MSELLPPSSHSERDDAGSAKPMAAAPAVERMRSGDAPPASRLSASAFSRAGVTRAMLIGAVIIAVTAAALAWIDVRRTQQMLRTEVAQRLADVDAATQTMGKTQSQLASELHDAQAKITLLETRLAE